jgi:hypothetical protein
MFIKNTSFEVLQAVIKHDNFITFQPQEIKEVSEENGRHFLERYPRTYMAEVFEKQEDNNPDHHPVVDELEPVEEKVVSTNTKCPVCGKVAKTNAGLKVHLKSHK